MLFLSCSLVIFIDVDMQTHCSRPKHLACGIMYEFNISRHLSQACCDPYGFKKCADLGFTTKWSSCSSCTISLEAGSLSRLSLQLLVSCHSYCRATLGCHLLFCAGWQTKKLEKKDRCRSSAVQMLWEATDTDDILCLFQMIPEIGPSRDVDSEEGGATTLKSEKWKLIGFHATFL